MEAMCSPTSVQPLETVVQCLKALRTLLDDAWPRRQLGNNKSLCIELLNVLHRCAATPSADQESDTYLVKNVLIDKSQVCWENM